MVISSNSNYSNEALRRIWQKATPVEGVDPSVKRKDLAGAWIRFDSYGLRSSDLSMGWEVDHQTPKSAGGSDNITNLRPLQWKNNADKSDNYPRWHSSVSSQGQDNIYKDQYWKIGD